METGIIVFAIFIMTAIAAVVTSRLWFPPEEKKSNPPINRSKNRWAAYLGIVLGALYGLLIRIVFENNSAFSDFFSFNLFSITFLWVVPVVIGIFPLWFASDARLRHPWYPLWSPVFAVFLFFASALISRLEDLLCLIIMAAPFLFGAMVAGSIVAPLILRYRRRKGHMLVLTAMPVLLMMIEGTQAPVAIEKQVHTIILVKASAKEVWNNIVRVSAIEDSEYVKGPFQWAGVPRPLMAELNGDSLGGRRLGHFEGGLQFVEQVTVWEPGRRLRLSIDVVSASLGNKIFERHLLKGDYFRFLAATYEMRPVDSETTELRLSCEYKLQSNVNGYTSLWGQSMISDFQQRLLAVIRKRCERRGLKEQILLHLNEKQIHK